MTTRRRGHGEGSIHRRKDGRWQAHLQVGVDSNGKRIRKFFYGRTQGEVRKKIDKARDQLRSSGTIASAGTLRVSKFLDQWQALHASRWRDRTRRDYHQVFEKHVKPRIGGMRLAALHAMHIESLLQTLEQDKVSSRIRLKVYRQLSTAFKHAVRKGLIPFNPCERVEAPRYRAPQRKPLSIAEARTFLEAAREHPLYPGILLGVMCGLRAAEIWGLRWTDLDLDARELRIQQTLNPFVLNEALRDGRSPAEALEPTKTENSARSIALPAVVAAALADYRRKQTLASALGLVFVDEQGNPIRHAAFYRSYRRLLRQAGIREITFHDGRHTAATLMLAAGVDLTVVSKTLGHATAAFTADAYAHVLDELRRDAADRMDRLLG